MYIEINSYVGQKTIKEYNKASFKTLGILSFCLTGKKLFVTLQFVWANLVIFYLKYSVLSI